ncbi:MAG: hypothetical protein ACYDBJ_10790 [Aggregatilineales bacterium]
MANLTGNAPSWDRGVALLCQMDAAAWVQIGGQVRTIERPPRLPTVT